MCFDRSMIAKHPHGDNHFGLAWQSLKPVSRLFLMFFCWVDILSISGMSAAAAPFSELLITLPGSEYARRAFSLFFSKHFGRFLGRNFVDFWDVRRGILGGRQPKKYNLVLAARRF